jgi:hypothetical protein
MHQVQRRMYIYCTNLNEECIRFIGELKNPIRKFTNPIWEVIIHNPERSQRSHEPGKKNLKTWIFTNSDATSGITTKS